MHRANKKRARPPREAAPANVTSVTDENLPARRRGFLFFLFALLAAVLAFGFHLYLARLGTRLSAGSSCRGRRFTGRGRGRSRFCLGLGRLGGRHLLGRLDFVGRLGLFGFLLSQQQLVLGQGVLFPGGQLRGQLLFFIFARLSRVHQGVEVGLAGFLPGREPQRRYQGGSPLESVVYHAAHRFLVGVGKGIGVAALGFAIAVRVRETHRRRHGLFNLGSPVEGFAQEAVALLNYRPDRVERVFDVLRGRLVVQQLVVEDEPLGQLAFPQRMQAFLVRKLPVVVDGGVQGHEGIAHVVAELSRKLDNGQRILVAEGLYQVVFHFHHHPRHGTVFFQGLGAVFLPGLVVLSGP